MNKVLKIAIVVVLCLIVILTITLFACNREPGGSTTTTTTITTTTTGNGGGDNPPPDCTEHVDENNDYVCDVCEAELERPADPECTEHVDANGDYICDVCEDELERPSDPECTEHVDANGDYVCDICEDELERPADPEPDGFEDVDDYVYVVSIELNVRTSPEIPENKNNIHSSVKFGAQLHRTGYSENWTRIEIDGTSYYVSSDCLGATNPVPVFDDVSDTMYVTRDYLSARITPYFNDEFNTVKSFMTGDTVKRTGVAREADSEGIVWSRIEFKQESKNEAGETLVKTVIAYISTKYLSDKDPNAQPTYDIEFEDCDWSIVITTQSYSLRSHPDYSLTPSKYVTQGMIIALNGIAKEADGDDIIWGRLEIDGETYYIITNPSNPKWIEVIKPGQGNSTPDQGGNTTPEAPETNDPEDFEQLLDSSLNITLHDGFTVKEQSATHCILNWNAQAVSILRAQMTAQVSLETYAKYVAGNMDIENVELATKNGTLYFEQEKDGAYYLFTFHEGANNVYYSVAFSGIGTKDTLESTFWEYADTVEIVTVAQ